MSYGPNYKRVMPLSELLEKRIAVICTDGNFFVGTLHSFDRFTNLVLRDCIERQVSPDGTDIHELGLFVIRGEIVATLGAVDEEKDESIDWEEVRAEPIKTTRIPY